MVDTLPVIDSKVATGAVVPKELLRTASSLGTHMAVGTTVAAATRVEHKDCIQVVEEAVEVALPIAVVVAAASAVVEVVERLDSATRNLTFAYLGPFYNQRFRSASW